MDKTDQIIKSFEEIISVLEPEWQKNPDMIDTPKRVAKMYRHFFRNDIEAIEDIFQKVFPTTNSQMVIIKDIKCYSLCPHHLLPIKYKIHIGYIPNGEALGLSKFGRLCIALASRPKLQENFTNEIAETIEKFLKPKGVMVVVEGWHGCMNFRGVEMDSSTITSDCRGAFRKRFKTREEFLELVK